jgi:phosphate transport system substrate-binding protein
LCASVQRAKLTRVGSAVEPGGLSDVIRSSVRRAPARSGGASPAGAAALIAAALLCAGPVRADEVIRLSGTGSALGAMARVARAYEAATPGAKVQVLSSLGTSGAIKAVAGGAIEVGLAARPLRPEERVFGLTAVPVAWTPFVFAAGPRAGGGGIGLAELVRIYRGEQRSWPGGERIRPVLRPAGDADTAYLRALSPELAAAYDAALARPGMLVGATNQDSDDLAGRTPGSLGCTTLAQLTTEPHGLTPLAWEGVAPTLANLAAGRYPLWKPFYAVAPASAPPRTARFLSFLKSAEARTILEAAGCLPPPFPARG